MTVELLAPDAATPTNPDWLEARRAAVSASEIAAVLGLSPWESPFSLYWRKVNGWQVETTEEMSTGTRVESVVAEWWADTHDPHENLAVVRAGLYAHPDRPWQLATPDRLIHMACPCCSDGRCRCGLDGNCADCRNTRLGSPPLAVLECKWTGSWAGWGEPGSDDIPVYYRAQLLWQMDVLQVDEGHLAVLGPGGFRAYTIRRDETDLKVMREAARRFLARLEAGDPPDVDDHTATLATLKRLHPNLVDDDAEISDSTAAFYRRARALRDHAERLLAAAEARLRAEMGNRRRAVHNGQVLATRSVYDTTRIAIKRLKAEHPDLAAQYSTTSTTDRLTPARSKKS